VNPKNLVYGCGSSWEIHAKLFLREFGFFTSFDPICLDFFLFVVHNVLKNYLVHIYSNLFYNNNDQLVEYAINKYLIKIKRRIFQN
jgi:hypothetical protein